MWITTRQLTKPFATLQAAATSTQPQLPLTPFPAAAPNKRLPLSGTLLNIPTLALDHIGSSWLPVYQDLNAVLFILGELPTPLCVCWRRRPKPDFQETALSFLYCYLHSMGHYKIFHTRLATERRANAGVISSFLNHHYTFLPANVPRSILDIYTLKYCIIIIYLFTAIGLLPGGSVYFTCKQNMKLATTRFKSGGLHEKHVVSCFVCTVVDLCY